MSLSTYTLDHFDKAQQDCNITQGLQLIGETRFALIYWSLQSVLNGFPAFTQIARDTSNGIDSEVFIIHLDGPCPWQVHLHLQL